MNSAERLERYAEMLKFSLQMLALARQAEWDRLVEVERERAVIADALMNHENNRDLSQSDQQMMAELIGSILEADNEIKHLTQDWMGELQEILGSIGTEKKLNKAYEIP